MPVNQEGHSVQLLLRGGREARGEAVPEPEARVRTTDEGYGAEPVRFRLLEQLTDCDGGVRVDHRELDDRTVPDGGVGLKRVEGHLERRVRLPLHSVVPVLNPTARVDGDALDAGELENILDGLEEPLLASVLGDFNLSRDFYVLVHTCSTSVPRPIWRSSSSMSTMHCRYCATIADRVVCLRFAAERAFFFSSASMRS